MFLFTTPTTPPPAVIGPSVAGPSSGAGSSSGSVVDAIRQGATQTGTDFAYLLNTAKRESALDPSAKAGTSSATGLFQFIEQTWLGLVKTEGGRLGLSDLAASISAREGGGLAVGDGSTRQAILKLREDPQLSALLAGVLTQQNREFLTTATGREPSPGELYMAHVLGARGASDLIRTADQNPDRTAALDLPDAAAANRSIFYDRSGRARSAAEVYGVLAANGAGDAAAAPTPASASAAAPATLAASAVPLPRSDGPVLYGLFQTDRRTGPISDAVAKLWKVGGRTDVATVTTLSYFPRVSVTARTDDAMAAIATPETSPVADAAPPPAPAPAADATTSAVPLPPPRPSDLASRRTASGARTAPSVSVPQADLPLTSRRRS